MMTQLDNSEANLIEGGVLVDFAVELIAAIVVGAFTCGVIDARSSDTRFCA